MDIADVKAGRDRSSQDAAWMVVGSLIAGMAFYGGIGWLIGLWTGHTPAAIACGVLFGMAAAMYLIHIRLAQATRPVIDRSHRSRGTGRIEPGITVGWNR